MGRAEARWLKEWAGGGRGTYGGGMRPGCARWGACAVSGLAADAFPPAQEGGAYALVSSAKNETTASRSFFVFAATLTQSWSGQCEKVGYYEIPRLHKPVFRGGLGNDKIN